MKTFDYLVKTQTLKVVFVQVEFQIVRRGRLKYKSIKLMNFWWMNEWKVIATMAIAMALYKYLLVQTQGILS